MPRIESRIAALEEVSQDDRLRLVPIAEGETQEDAILRARLPDGARSRVIFVSTVDERL